MFKDKLIEIIKPAVENILDEAGIDNKKYPPIIIESPKREEFGDLASPLAMNLTKLLKRPPMEIAELIKNKLPDEQQVYSKIKIAAPGFLNFWLSKELIQCAVKEIISKGSKYGQLNLGRGEKTQIEFVSANPVGPMHLGHGRWAAVGDTLARVLSSVGYEVEKEFYINDYGTQMDIFAHSVSTRYCQELGKDLAFPKEGYRGAYIIDIAKEIIEDDGAKYLELPDKEREVIFKERAYQQVLKHIKNSLELMRVQFDVWFSERSLHEQGELDRTLEELNNRGLVYKKDGATWLKTIDFGDDKDRVLIRESGEPTYFFADIAYHHNKYNRGFKRVINIWGADHHGYVKRMKAAVQAMGYSKDALEVIIGQLVNLLRGGEPVRMSKRTGEMVTLDELLDEVGVDAVRYFFTMRSTDTPLDFDIVLAKEESQNNPVYYVQYAHARICSILKYGSEQGFNCNNLEEADLHLLTDNSELSLIMKLSELEDVIERTADKKMPYFLCSYIEEVSTAFHYFYTKCRVISEDQKLTRARLALVCSVKIVLANVLALLGVSAPESM